MAPGTSVPTVVAQYEIWFQGSRYPVNPNPKHEQHDTGNPVEIAGRLVGPVEENPQHVQEYHDDHSVGRPVMQPAKEPSERHVVRDVHNALVRLRHRGPVVHEQHYAGCGLDEKQQESYPAEAICEVDMGRHGFLQIFLERVLYVEPFIELPVNESGQREQLEQFPQSRALLDGRLLFLQGLLFILCHRSRFSYDDLVLRDLGRYALQGARGGPADYVAVDIERGDMAGAYQLALRAVPLDDATEVGADRRQRMDRLLADAYCDAGLPFIPKHLGAAHRQLGERYTHRLAFGL
jgi:hypothetical protein